MLDGRGLASLRYKPDDPRTYSVRPSELAAVDDPAAPPRPSRPRRAKAPARAPAPDDGFEPGDDVPALAGLAVHAYTDGASSGNPGPSGAGVVLLFRERRKELSKYLGETTNNVAELEAVLLALGAIKDRRLPVRVHADSSYVIGVLEGGMKAKANSSLIARIRAELLEFADVRFVKVPAHAGVEHNERADALARLAIRTRRSDATGPGGVT